MGNKLFEIPILDLIGVALVAPDKVGKQFEPDEPLDVSKEVLIDELKAPFIRQLYSFGHVLDEELKDNNGTHERLHRIRECTKNDCRQFSDNSARIEKRSAAISKLMWLFIFDMYPTLRADAELGLRCGWKLIAQRKEREVLSAWWNRCLRKSILCLRQNILCRNPPRSVFEPRKEVQKKELAVGRVEDLRTRALYDTCLGFKLAEKTLCPENTVEDVRRWRRTHPPDEVKRVTEALYVTVRFAELSRLLFWEALRDEVPWTMPASGRLGIRKNWEVVELPDGPGEFLRTKKGVLVDLSDDLGDKK